MITRIAQIIKFIENQWYRRTLSFITFLLLPFSWIFRLLISIRYFLYRLHFKKKINFNIPIIVVGNVTMGGTGKTPLVIYLAEILQKKGFNPGIVSRGVGGKKCLQPHWVDAKDQPKSVGDEAVLLVKRTQCPMVICIDRVQAVNLLLKKTNCNIVISDDGLQHDRLSRNIEIVVIDGAREFGNGQLFPAGPLRQPLKKLSQVDFIIINGKNKLHHPLFKLNKLNKISKKSERMILNGNQLVSMMNPDERISIDIFQQKRVHAIAGIGHPNRFFKNLREFNLNVIEHVYPDHYLYRREDIYFEDDLPVIMTEKDAVKCMNFSDKRHWFLPVSVEMNLGFEKKFFSLLFSLLKEEERVYATFQNNDGIINNLFTIDTLSSSDER